MGLLMGLMNGLSSWKIQNKKIQTKYICTYIHIEKREGENQEKSHITKLHHLFFTFFHTSTTLCSPLPCFLPLAMAEICMQRGVWVSEREWCSQRESPIKGRGTFTLLSFTFSALQNQNPSLPSPSCGRNLARSKESSLSSQFIPFSCSSKKSRREGKDPCKLKLKISSFLLQQV